MGCDCCGGSTPGCRQLGYRLSSRWPNLRQGERRCLLSTRLLRRGLRIQLTAVWRLWRVRPPPLLSRVGSGESTARTQYLHPTSPCLILCVTPYLENLRLLVPVSYVAE